MGILANLIKTAPTNHRVTDDFRPRVALDYRCVEREQVGYSLSDTYTFHTTITGYCTFNADRTKPEQLAHAEQHAVKRIHHMFYGPIQDNLMILKSNVLDGDREACLKKIDEIFSQIDF